MKPTKKEMRIETLPSGRVMFHLWHCGPLGAPFVPGSGVTVPGDQANAQVLALLTEGYVLV